MQFLTNLFGTCLSIVVLVVVFVPIEKVFPARVGQKIFRPHWFLDLCFFLGQYLLWGGLVIGLLEYFGSWLDGIVPQEFRQGVAAQAW